MTDECVRGHLCNLALVEPICVRQFTLNVGTTSSEASLCKSNHVVPTRRCAPVPPLAYSVQNRPLVGGIDCQQDADCPRTDGSFGVCRCKLWWTGEGTPGYCELSVQDSSRPAFQRFWESRFLLCHQDWTDERCATETGMQATLRQRNNELMAQLSDPSAVQPCAAEMLSTDFVDYRSAVGPRALHFLRPLFAAALSLAASI